MSGRQKSKRRGKKHSTLSLKKTMAIVRANA